MFCQRLQHNAMNENEKFMLMAMCMIVERT